MVSPPSETSSRTVLSLLLRKSLSDLKRGKGQQGWGREKGLVWPSAAMRPPGKLRASVGPTRSVWERGSLGLAGSPSPQGAAPGPRVVVRDVKSIPRGASRGRCRHLEPTPTHLPHRPDAEMGAALVARGPEWAGQRGLCLGSRCGREHQAPRAQLGGAAWS